MMQYSIYTRTCNGYNAVQKHKQRLNENLPENGSVRLLTITEKQYESLEILVGKLTLADTSAIYEQLSIF